MPRTASVKAIIYHEGKFLMVKNRWVQGYWVFPGGGVEPGEDILSALRRELVEEINVTPKIGNLLFLQQIKQKDGYSPPEFFFHVSNPEDFIKHDLYGSSRGEAELEGIDWIDVADAAVLPEFMSAELPEAVESGFDMAARVRL